MSFNKPQWKRLSVIREEMDTAFSEGNDVLINYNNYQTEVSNDIKRLENKLRDHGVKSPSQYDCNEVAGRSVIEWKFYKPKNAKQGRFRLCFNGTPLLETPFEVRAYAHQQLPVFYRGVIMGMQISMDYATNYEYLDNEEE
tara:strand:- start:47 stop:469 length:423 start_codon:yes stop_codon:yes gene_type:complete